MALRARIYEYNRHLSFDVAFICSTLTHCGVCHLNVWRLKWEVSYVHQSVWRWKWFFCQSNYVLQRLRLCRTSDTVFRREIDSRRQWGYGTCYGGIVSPLRRSVCTTILFPMLAIHQIKHQATCQMGCHPGDCKWPLKSSSGTCVRMYGSTYSLYQPWGVVFAFRVRQSVQIGIYSFMIGWMQVNDTQWLRSLFRGQWKCPFFFKSKHCFSQVSLQRSYASL